MLPLDENEVIAALCEQLVDEGYSIEQRLHTTQKGVDVIALSPDGERLFIEAKGATSSRPGSKAHGKPFGSSDTRINVAEAFYTASIVAARAEPGVVAAVAFHDDPLHRRYVEPLTSACQLLGIRVFWIGSRPTGQA